MFLVTTVSDLFFYRPRVLHGVWQAGWLTLSLLLGE
jgi:hypothetical protein